MTNPLTTVQEMLESHRADQQFQATVVDELHGAVRVQREGSSVLEGPYPRITGVTVSAGDLVLVNRLGTSYIVMGKIDRVAIPLVPVPPVSLVLGGDLRGTTLAAIVNKFHSGSQHVLAGEVTGAIANVDVETVHGGSRHYPTLGGQVWGDFDDTVVASSHSGSVHPIHNTTVYGTLTTTPGTYDPPSPGSWSTSAIDLSTGEWLLITQGRIAGLGFSNATGSLKFDGTTVATISGPNAGYRFFIARKVSGVSDVHWEGQWPYGGSVVASIMAIRAV